MNRNTRINKQGDRLLKMPGKFDRGPHDFESRIAPREGEIMAIASREVGLAVCARNMMSSTGASSRTATLLPAPTAPSTNTTRFAREIVSASSGVS